MWVYYYYNMHGHIQLPYRENAIPCGYANFRHSLSPWKSYSKTSPLIWRHLSLKTIFLKISSVSNNEQTLQKVLKFYPGFRNLIKTLICRFICVVVSLFVCISDLFSSRIFWKYVACVFFSSRIEIHCFIKGKLPEKSRCKILSARFPKTQFSWYFFYSCIYLYLSRNCQPI